MVGTDQFASFSHTLAGAHPSSMDATIFLVNHQTDVAKLGLVQPWLRITMVSTNRGFGCLCSKGIRHSALSSLSSVRKASGHSASD